MTEAPLRPFAPPSGPFFDHLSFNGSVSTNAALTWTLFAISICWMVYTLVAVYHWIKYSHASYVAIPAIVVHLVISLILIGLAVSGLAV